MKKPQPGSCPESCHAQNLQLYARQATAVATRLSQHIKLTGPVFRRHLGPVVSGHVPLCAFQGGKKCAACHAWDRFQPRRRISLPVRAALSVVSTAVVVGEIPVSHWRWQLMSHPELVPVLSGWRSNWSVARAVLVW